MTNVDWARECNNKALSASGRGALSEVWMGWGWGCSRYYWVPASSECLILGLFNVSLCHCEKQGPLLF